jgi:hypothetical protein
MPPKGHTVTEHGFATLDVNKDNRVSQAEASSHADLKTAFPTLDSDRDNHLSAAEFAKFKPQPTPMK